MHKITNSFNWLKVNYSKKLENENRRVYTTILAFSLIALLGSFILAVDEFYILKHPDAVLNCSLNLVLNCSEVMKTWQAEVFGFPNMFVGLMAYSALAVVAVIGLLGIKYPKNFLIALNFGVLSGLLFSEWLIFESIYSIQILCPYCLVVAASTIVVFGAVTHLSLRNDAFSLPKKTNEKVQKFLDSDYDKVVIVAWLLLLAALIVQHFGSSLFA